MIIMIMMVMITCNQYESYYHLYIYYIYIHYIVIITHYYITLHGDESKPWYLVNPKIAGKWMFIPLKMYL